MARASILEIDDDLAVLNSVEANFRQKYGREYRILKCPQQRCDAPPANVDAIDGEREAAPAAREGEE